VTSKRRKAEIRWHIFAGIVLPVVGTMVKLRIREGSRLPAQGPFIVSPNHFSEIDPILMGIVVWKLRRTPRFLAKASLFRVPLLGWLMRFTGQIPVERDSNATLGEPLKAAGELVTRGQGVIVYPEGTLTKDPDLWPMKGKVGAVRMALQSDIPVKLPFLKSAIEVIGLLGSSRNCKSAPSRVGLSIHANSYALFGSIKPNSILVRGTNPRSMFSWDGKIANTRAFSFRRFNWSRLCACTVGR